MPLAIASSLHPGLKGGESFGLSPTCTSRIRCTYLCPVSALHTPCFMRGAAVFCGAMASGGWSFTTIRGFAGLSVFDTPPPRRRDFSPHRRVI